MQQKINNEEEILLELQKLEKQKKQAEKMQKEYNFLIPNYVLAEMQTGNENIFSLIDLLNTIEQLVQNHDEKKTFT